MINCLTILFSLLKYLEVVMEIWGNKFLRLVLQIRKDLRKPKILIFNKFSTCLLSAIVCSGTIYLIANLLNNTRMLTYLLWNWCWLIFVSGYLRKNWLVFESTWKSNIDCKANLFLLLNIDQISKEKIKIKIIKNLAIRSQVRDKIKKNSKIHLNWLVRMLNKRMDPLIMFKDQTMDLK